MVHTQHNCASLFWQAQQCASHSSTIMLFNFVGEAHAQTQLCENFHTVCLKRGSTYVEKQRNRKYPKKKQTNLRKTKQNLKPQKNTCRMKKRCSRGCIQCATRGSGQVHHVAGPRAPDGRPFQGQPPTTEPLLCVGSHACFTNRIPPPLLPPVIPI